MTDNSGKPVSTLVRNSETIQVKGATGKKLRPR